MASPSSVDPAALASSASASQRADESDLDPAAFLKSVRALSEKREREDAERYRKLEEEIERSRQDRAARRAERARSISPQKSLPPTTNAPRPATNNRGIETPPPSTPPTASPATMDTSGRPSSTDIPEFKGFGSSNKSKMTTPSTQSPADTSETSESATKSSPSVSSLARSGTLSWQQRPSSRGTTSRPRSMFVVETSTPTKSALADKPEVSRDQIAASLGARDPAWFRQTADRGVGNAAFRKNADESMAVDSFASGRRGLPGMQREAASSPARPRSPTPSESVKSDTLSHVASAQDTITSLAGHFSTIRTSTSSKPDLKSLIAEDEGQAKASPMSEQISSITDGDTLGIARATTMSSSQARLASTIERPGSPTKGMGGFVQSAMMKRSDSVSKRWSAQPGASLSRQNSIASARDGGVGIAGSQSMPRMDVSSTANEPLPKPYLSTDSSLRPGPTDAQASSAASNFTSQSQARGKLAASSAEDLTISAPSSPSKRWSPTKSTWLESAITKPESPKPSTARNSQPSWMADIAKAKAQRASVEVTPKQTNGGDSRSSSPTKQLFGRDVLKRSESRDLETSQAPISKPAEQQVPVPASPTKFKLESDKVDLLHAKPDSQSSGSTQTPVVEPRVSSNLTSDPQPKAQSSTAKPKPETPPKPQTDFRGALRTRPQTEARQEDTPEFLSKFGNLRKATTQNYVAPDVLKDNILRGKSDLTKTGGPVKTQRRDELKESLLAKKEQWKKEKDEGIVHERKVSQPPVAPQKPEALAKRDVLGRSESIKTPQVLEKPTTAVPEALARQRSLTNKGNVESSLPNLQKQTSAPAPAPASAPAEPDLIQPKKQTSTPVTTSTLTQPTETSKMAARFNPGLAGILARGPPAMQNGSSAASRSENSADADVPSVSRISAPSEPPAEGGQLQDMRKGRAKGPKKRKGGTKDMEGDTIATRALEPSPEPEPASTELLVDAPVPGSKPTEEPEALPRTKPKALPGSAASLMVSSLQKPTELGDKPATPTKNRKISGPRPMTGTPSTAVQSKLISTPEATLGRSTVSAQSPAVPIAAMKHSADRTPLEAPSGTPAPPQKPDVPEFKGFGSAKTPAPTMRLLDDDKENFGQDSPSVKSAASQWGKQPVAHKTDPPSQIQLPSKRDEEAAMRSAGLLASSPGRPGSSNGLGISVHKSNGIMDTPPSSAKLPPKPVKSSRAVSGQLQEASPNKGSLGWFDSPKNGMEQQLRQTFGSIPNSTEPLSIDTQSIVSTGAHQDRIFKTLRKSVQVVLPDGGLKELSRKEEYTFFDESVYICTHAYSVADSAKKTEMFLWSGESSSKAAAERAEATAKRLSKDVGSAYVHAISQGLEPSGFLQALGGILLTRRGSHQAASKQYLLRGRKHLGQIVFDEVDFGVKSLQSGFAYLISYPVTLQECRLYLWKGSAASTEEVSAARLAAADLSETHEVIEVDDGTEFASFLKIFGAGTTKASIDKPAELWQQKALAPDKFSSRLFRIQPAEAKAGLFSNIFTRRPSWGSASPARKDESQGKIMAKEISPFTQSDLEADCIYLLDAYSALYVLVGPVFPSQSEAVRNLLFGQALLFASDYAMLAASTDDRPSVPTGLVLLGGVPAELKLLFRHWDEDAGLWGTGELMAGVNAQKRNELEILDLEAVRGIVCGA